MNRKSRRTKDTATLRRWTYRDDDGAVQPADSPDPGFTYSEMGATRGTLPAGARHLEQRRTLGHGRALFDRTATEILGFGIQRRTGILHYVSTPTAEPGTDITVRLGWRRLGISASSRVVYVLNEANRRGFAYGTLPGHPLSGEELFAVEYDSSTDTVQGVVTSFSRANTWFTALGGISVRWLQHAMARHYLRALPSGGSY